MRIAVLCTDQGVRVPGTKGASLHLLAISRAFARLGHDVLVVGIEGREAPPDDLTCLCFPHPGRTEGIERERRKLRLVERITVEAADPMKTFAPDVIYERLSLFGTAGLHLAEQCNATHVLEINALLAAEEARWRGLHHVDEAAHRERDVLNRVQLRICVSTETATAVERVAPGPATIVVPNGVDTELFTHLPSQTAARQEFDLPPEVAMVGFVGSLRPWHGLEVALEAMTSLPHASLVVAGSGPIQTELGRYADRAGLSRRVHWLGNVAHDRIPALLAGLDVAIAPYPPLEGFSFSPLKLFEYLAAGVPIVASDIGQVRAILEDGRWGALVEPGDPIALAAGIRQILKNPALARAKSSSARFHAQTTHDWTARATDIIAALQSCSVSRELAP